MSGHVLLESRTHMLGFVLVWAGEVGSGPEVGQMTVDLELGRTTRRKLSWGRRESLE